MKNKTLKQFIFKRMEKKGYVLDNEVFKFLSDKQKMNYNTIERYKQEYKQMKWAKSKFKNIKNPILKHCNRKYLIRDDSWEKNLYNIIPKIYYDYLKNYAKH